MRIYVEWKKEFHSVTRALETQTQFFWDLIRQFPRNAYIKALSWKCLMVATWPLFLSGFSGPTARSSPGSLLEMPNLKPPLRLTESAFSQGLGDGGGHSVHFRMILVSSVSGLHSLDVRDTTPTIPCQVVTIKYVSRHCQVSLRKERAAKSSPLGKLENHWVNWTLLVLLSNGKQMSG